MDSKIFRVKLVCLKIDFKVSFKDYKSIFTFSKSICVEIMKTSCKDNFEKSIFIIKIPENHKNVFQSKFFTIPK